MKNLLLLLLLLGFTTACDSNNDTPEPEEEIIESRLDELVFGIYYGRCSGDCTHFFKLKDGVMYKDVIEERYDGTEWDRFSASTARTDEYELAVGLMESIPDFLLESTQEKFGNPNAADQGTFFVVAKKGDTQMGPWLIDPFANQVGEELQDFHAELTEVLSILVN